MTTTTLSLTEAEVTESVAERYRSLGYEVHVLPTREETPRFLAAFAPDLIALSDADKVVVEIKASEALKDKGELSSLAQAVENERGWRLEVIYRDHIEGKRARNPGRAINRHRIADRLREVEDLLDERKNDAGLLLLSASIEAALRLAGKKQEIDFHVSHSSTYILKKAYAEGLLTKKQFEDFSEVLSLRNLVAHGIRAEIKNTPLLRRAVVNCLALLREAVDR